MTSTHILIHGDGKPQRTPIFSDHSEIPCYPQSDPHASPSDDPVALPQNDAPPPRSLAQCDLNGKSTLGDDYPTFPPKDRRLHQRPVTASTTTSFTSASAETPALPSITSVSSSRDTSLKKATPSRIGRSFEALLASDETYVLREPAKVALDPEDSFQSSGNLTSSQALLAPSSSANRVIVERQRGQSNSSFQSDGPAEFDEQFVDTTPRPPDAIYFQSPPRKPQPSISTGTIVRSVSNSVRSNGGQAPASPDRTTSLQRSPAAFPGASSHKSARQTAPMSAMPGFMLPRGTESPGGTMRARPRASSSIGLEQEINASPTSQGGAAQSASTGSFRQRMKKTSGFLRKLRKDNTQGRRNKDAPTPSGSSSSSHTYSFGSNPSATSLGRSGASETTLGAISLGRRESKASMLSQGGSSTTGSASHSHHKQSTHFNSTEGIAVPSIPERFMQPSSTSHSPASANLAGIEHSTPEQDQAISADAQVLAPPSRSGLRVPSAPATLTEWSPASKIALPQRSSSQGHERKKSLHSSDSSGDIRVAIRQLESQMDHALKDAPAQAASGAEQHDAQIPKQRWGPSPQLPELNIQRYKERSGSFLEEDLVAPGDYAHAGLEGPEFVRSSNVASDSTIAAIVDPYPGRKHKGPEHVAAKGLGITSGTPNQQSVSARRVQQSSNGDALDPTLSRSSENGLVEDGGANPITNNPQPLQSTDSLRRQHGGDSPRYANSTRSSRRNSIIDPASDVVPRRTADSGASLISVRSFETAAESAGLDSADPKTSSFIMPPHLVDGARTASPRLSNDQASVFVDSPLVGQNALRRQAARPIASTDAKPESGRQVGGEGDESSFPDVVNEQEQSIRLVTKRSNTDDLNVSPIDDPATTIITGPTSPDMDSAALPKMVELSENSFLRPGRNGSISRDYSGSSASVKAGLGLLSTPSIRRSPSVSSPTSARTSFDAISRPAHDEGTALLSVAPSAQELATKCWEEDPEFLKQDKIAEWLGGLGLINRAARGFYFSNFDFSGLRLDIAFRKLCDKLFLRAETQQIDRVLAAFSQRYYECNTDSVFGSADVVHSVVFSILLLNTDLHIAELQDRMTRQQFVRNTLDAIVESSPDTQPLSAQDDSRSSFGVAPNEFARSSDAIPMSYNAAQQRNSISSYLGGRSKQASSSTNVEASLDTARQDNPHLAAGVSGVKSKEAEIETMLKNIYAAVKSERILLPNAELGPGTVTGRPSGTFSSAGGRRKMGIGSDRMTALKRGSIRGIQGLLGGLGSNPALLDPSISPNPSRSSVESWGRPSQSSASGSDRDRMRFPLPSTTPGFASTLTQTIIKESMEEEAAARVTSQFSPAETPVEEEEDDDKLALAGPPWAKEGSLTRKHYWESAGKRSKDKSWTEMFVVVSRGTLSMFRFDTSGSSSATGTSSRAKGRPSAAPSSAALGGGNWLSNATCLGEIPLAHSLANALPPPGYNKTRPHVFALTLPGGKVLFFQTGHEELVNEWVSTCNYWAARQSKEPLAGGVSNMEYGWNKVLPQLPDDEYEELDSLSATSRGPDGSIYAPSSSQHTMDNRSVRSGKSSGRARAAFASPTGSAATSIGTSSNAGFMSNERTFINEWRNPQLPTVPSTLSEERQLARLEKQVSTIEGELTLHNELRQPMLTVYSPRGQNYTKALSNWERKSNYLLQELVKYQSYVEALRKSSDLKGERRAKREVEGMIEAGDAALAELSM
ncbi:uncharacterized protein MEPE_00590 [Melanopsichium pennsylvanicum]|uniref:SEC7 domain-containing protein n=2 Tax=Melanopsichium pennsylvanicum TaxID=63383 RepID=A0AAJ5C2T2_9BASI|nr:sec7 domain gef [Melanopsichium pennsylvanicum 4]SNX81885.1 uncharacterized protein MEPE_00590 [Melanopsichium pennsylvanicum]